jgi:hypothetical protein
MLVAGRVLHMHLSHRKISAIKILLIHDLLSDEKLKMFVVTVPEFDSGEGDVLHIRVRTLFAPLECR